MAPATLDRWLTRHRLSGLALARRLGVAESTVYRWRRGLRVPPPWLPLALAQLATTLQREPVRARKAAR
jgi:transcriptional regulator with XRE-family HTH domain